MNNDSLQKQAEQLFLNTGRSQKEIAQQLGIDPKTLYRWMKQGHWRELRSATRRMPSILVENIYSQLDDLNHAIAARDRGDRYPTRDESLTINRLINSIGKVKKEVSQGQNIEFMMSFIGWIQQQDDELAKRLTEFGSAYLKSAPLKGFHPYDIEYGTDDEESSPGHRNTQCSDCGQARDETPHTQNAPWPNDPNCPNNDTLLPAATADLRETRDGAEAQVGYDSGIPSQSETNTQHIDDQHIGSNISPGQMPENNAGENRASSRPCLPDRQAGEAYVAPCKVTEKQPCVDDADPPPAPLPLPPAAIDYTPPTDEERADPQYFVKQYLREQGIDPDIETQLFSIGEQVFTLRYNKNKERSKRK